MIIDKKADEQPFPTNRRCKNPTYYLMEETNAKAGKRTRKRERERERDKERERQREKEKCRRILLFSLLVVKNENWQM